MKVLKSKRNNDRVELEIEIAHEELETAMEKAYVKVSKNAKVPGFRKGKVPRHLFEKHYGKGHIIQEGILDAVNEQYYNAIQELQLEVIDKPQNIDIKEYKENEPITFSAEVDVRPEVKLGKYKGLKVSKESSDVEDSAITEQIDALRENFAEYGSSDAPVKLNDVVRLDVTATLDGAAYEQWSRQNVGLKVSAGHYGPDFDDQLLGLNKGAEKSFSISYSDEFANEDVKGKSVDFTVAVQDINTRTLPELTDEFVAKATRDEIKTVSDLQERVRTDMETRAKQESEQKLHESLIELACDDAKVNIQPVLVERQVDQNIKEFERDIQKSGMDMGRYLSMLNKTLDEMKDNFRPNAEKQVKAELVLDAIKEKESIEATEDDIIEEFKKMNNPEFDTDEKIKAFMANTPLEGFNYMVERRKTIDFLVENAKIK